MLHFLFTLWKGCFLYLRKLGSNRLLTEGIKNHSTIWAGILQTAKRWHRSSLTHGLKT